MATKKITYKGFSLNGVYWKTYHQTVSVQSAGGFLIEIPVPEGAKLEQMLKDMLQYAVEHYIGAEAAVAIEQEEQKFLAAQAADEDDEISPF